MDTFLVYLYMYFISSSCGLLKPRSKSVLFNKCNIKYKSNKMLLNTDYTLGIYSSVLYGFEALRITRRRCSKRLSSRRKFFPKMVEIMYE